jgi:hypothetical protein
MTPAPAQQRCPANGNSSSTVSAAQTACALFRYKHRTHSSSSSAEVPCKRQQQQQQSVSCRAACALIQMQTQINTSSSSAEVPCKRQQQQIVSCRDSLHSVLDANTNSQQSQLGRGALHTAADVGQQQQSAGYKCSLHTSSEADVTLACATRSTTCRHAQ